LGPWFTFSSLSLWPKCVPILCHFAIGKIVEGYDICTKISKVPTRDDNPRTPVKMNSVTIQM